jgi:hypothetical protein
MCGARRLELDSVSNSAAVLNIVSAMFALSIGISQAIHLIPTLQFFKRRGLDRTFRGSLAAAKVTLGIWATFVFFLFLGLTP